MSTHAIAATYERDIDHGAGLPDAELLIYFTFIPGTRAQGPSYASGGEPASPAEVEYHHAEFADGRPAPEFSEWASVYLQSQGYDAAITEAAERSQPDPDYERERRLDDAMEGNAW